MPWSGLAKSNNLRLCAFAECRISIKPCLQAFLKGLVARVLYLQYDQLCKRHCGSLTLVSLFQEILVKAPVRYEKIDQ